MRFVYFELLDLIKPTKRNILLEIFNKDYVFAQLRRQILDGGRSKINYKMVIEMFSYFNIKVSYGIDLYRKTQNLVGVQLPEEKLPHKVAQTKIENISAAKTLIYLYSIDNRNKHNLYFYLKQLLLKCDRIDFRWAMRIIGDNEHVKALMKGVEE